MTEEDRAKLEAVVKEAKDKMAQFKQDTGRYQTWASRYDYYTAELAKLGGDSDTGIEKPRGQR